jgi:hypothetical protein
MTTASRTSLFLLLAVAACDTATNETYRGPPVAALRGTMTARAGLTLNGPVRLSVLWFARESTGPGSLLGVRSDEVAYTGTFPQAYELRLDGLPPTSALQMTDAGEVGTSGVLVAYEDTNGDGQLTLAQGGPVLDRVLGASSVAFLSSRSAAPKFDAQYLVYLDSVGSAQPADAGLGYFVQSIAYLDGGLASDIAAINAATMPLELTGGADLALLACGDLYASFLRGTSAAETLCGIAPPNQLSPQANVQLLDDKGSTFVSFASLGVDGGLQTPPGIADASVTLNGVALASTSSGVFSLYESPNLTIGETNTVRVVAAGFAPFEGRCVMPAAFSVMAPTSVHPGESVVVSWSESGGAFTLGTLGTQSAYSPATSVSVVAPADAGFLTFAVSASGGLFPPAPVRCSRTVTGRVLVVP